MGKYIAGTLVLAINSFIGMIFLLAGAGTILNRLFHIPVGIGIVIYLFFLFASLFFIVYSLSDIDKF